MSTNLNTAQNPTQLLIKHQQPLNKKIKRINKSAIGTNSFISGGFKNLMEAQNSA